LAHPLATHPGGRAGELVDALDAPRQASAQLRAYADERKSAFFA